MRLVPGAADAIRRIRSLDYRTVVVSNQPGVAKGKASHEDLREAHRHVVRLLAEQGVAIDDYRYCLHHPEAVDPSLARACECRKPKPGMLLEAAADLDIDLSPELDDRGRRRRRGGRTPRRVQDDPRREPAVAHRRRDDGRVDYRVKDVAQAADIVARETR